MKLKAIFQYRSQNNDGYYAEDNPEADYPREVYFPPTWSTHLVFKEFESSDIQKIFDEEDGDEDYSNTLAFITDENDKVIFNPCKYKTRQDYDYAVKHLLAIYGNIVEEEDEE